ncbi:hypothetical protein CISG_01247 [Coccidioides immitis RMSCC 3703]|uniref:Uncharacterized protein n=1 Tax=Coccidioides immitis RMSCC 3703 TaxID=454286 RepID=A0A0J8QUE3_COCIT|nr:hypothetical protein CISG_01247 [Coccidioides immitis RMSCC 3703]
MTEEEKQTANPDRRKGERTDDVKSVIKATRRLVELELWKPKTGPQKPRQSADEGKRQAIKQASEATRETRKRQTLISTGGFHRAIGRTQAITSSSSPLLGFWSYEVSRRERAEGLRRGRVSSTRMDVPRAHQRNIHTNCVARLTNQSEPPIRCWLVRKKPICMDLSAGLHTCSMLEFTSSYGGTSPLTADFKLVRYSVPSTPYMALFSYSVLGTRDSVPHIRSTFDHNEAVQGLSWGGLAAQHTPFPLRNEE